MAATSKEQSQEQAKSTTKTKAAAEKPAAKKKAPAPAKKPAPITEESEIKRLSEIYKNLSPKRFALAQGLIVQAARIRVKLNILNEDIQKNGLTEWFQQSEKVEPYEKTRAAADLFTKYDKNYQSICKQLEDMILEDVDPVDDFSEFRK